MVSEAPPFWWKKADWRAAMLLPLSATYGAIAARQLHRARREPIDLPVICVGNLTVGGTGKTPIAIALARAASTGGFKPGFLSRGYGGAVRTPRFVDPHHDSARTVGDEPLLLAEHAPVAVTPDRAAGARLLAGRGCDLVIMDDGFQSARIHMDYAMLVIDSQRGIGNGHVIPGGPMRAPLVDQLRHADGVVRMGSGQAADDVVRRAARAGRPVFDAAYRTREPERFSGRSFLAFAGIGNPDNFFATLEAAGANVTVARAFPDHHFFTGEDIAELTATAEKEGLELVTTAKDAVRLASGSSAERAFAERVEVLTIDATFDLDSAPDQIVASAQETWRRRRHKS